ncbi:NAD-binding protein [Algisphaera agarilytica]|uniref:CPA2 family monovalent cation:H+ antiporter-2 n=1 Tax=Algisphaera agarilytica TaxID=1385975 RepID=A0A7X0LL43_9BACT|nr:NAD(P)-binding protein [Algisphaera agarilytica]MBB6429603.1 CPA2 family monovalent cation:H+ antiporter-2 [Algisphaera agarilytica]
MAAPPSPAPRTAIVVGFGPVGRLVAEGLADAGFEVTILETNPKTVEQQRSLGRRVLLGDARLADDLIAAGIETADTMVLTMPNEEDALTACRVAHGIRPEVFISARTNFVSKGMLAMQNGADHVVVEELVTAEAMRKAIVDHWMPD